MKAVKLHKVKRTKQAKKQVPIILISIIAIILAIVIILVLVEKNRIERTLEGEEPIGEDVVVAENHEEQFEMVDVSDMPDSMKGYTVIGKIVIDKIGMQSYILGKGTNESLNLAVVKFWGPHINDPRQLLYLGA